MADLPFTVGIIQDAATDDARETVEATIPRIREAATRGAQIVCLKELFNAPYFCKVPRLDRFDLAEAIPGPTTQAMQKISKELGIVLVVPLFERQAKGVYRNSAAIIDADGSLLGIYRKMHIPDDPLYHEKYTIRRHWRAYLLGSVVPGGGPHHHFARRRHPVLSDCDRLASE
jgi:N-carbamoylputrescine amidase